MTPHDPGHLVSGGVKKGTWNDNAGVLQVADISQRISDAIVAADT